VRKSTHKIHNMRRWGRWSVCKVTNRATGLTLRHETTARISVQLHTCMSHCLGLWEESCS